MPLSKEAAVRVKNLKHLNRILGRYSKQGFKGGKSGIDMAHNNLYGKSGSGSFLVDSALRLVTGKQNKKKILNKYKNVQGKLADKDIRAANFLQNKLRTGKGGFRDSLANSLVHKVDLPLKETLKGVPNKKIQLEVPGLGAPLDKVKGAVLPTVGTFTVAGKLGDLRGGEKMQKQQSTKSELIDKIATYVCENKVSDLSKAKPKIDTSVKKEINKLSHLATVASQMLKVAASEHRKLLSENEKLAQENEELNSYFENKEKKERAEKLATLMNEKGVIKKSEIPEQINKIAELDETGYDMLKVAMEKISLNSDVDGVDNLTFLSEDINIDMRDKRMTLADSIIDT